MQFVVLILFVVLLVGCSPQQTNPAAAATPTSGPFSDFRAADDPKFSVEEQRMIAAARAYLEKRRGKALDARYQVKGTKMATRCLRCLWERTKTDSRCTFQADTGQSS
jgi:hypothetical protein